LYRYSLVARLTHHVIKAQAGYMCEPREVFDAKTHHNLPVKYKRRGDKIKIVFNDTSQLTVGLYKSNPAKTHSLKAPGCNGSVCQSFLAHLY
jgi:hypothetical protein